MHEWIWQYALDNDPWFIRGCTMIHELMSQYALNDDLSILEVVPLYMSECHNMPSMMISVY